MERAYIGSRDRHFLDWSGLHGWLRDGNDESLDGGRAIAGGIVRRHFRWRHIVNGAGGVGGGGHWY